MHVRQPSAPSPETRAIADTSSPVEDLLEALEQRRPLLYRPFCWLTPLAFLLVVILVSADFTEPRRLLAWLSGIPLCHLAAYEAYRLTNLLRRARILEQLRLTPLPPRQALRTVRVTVVHQATPLFVLWFLLASHQIHPPTGGWMVPTIVIPWAILWIFLAVLFSFVQAEVFVRVGIRLALGETWLAPFRRLLTWEKFVLLVFGFGATLLIGHLALQTSHPLAILAAHHAILCWLMVMAPLSPFADRIELEEEEATATVKVASPSDEPVRFAQITTSEG
jgi:hypothetical protein